MSLSLALTGIGLLSPFGYGREVFWSGLAGGESRLVRPPARDHELPLELAHVPGLPATEADPYPEFSKLPTPTRRGLLAAREAWLDARATDRSPDLERVGLYLGTTYGLLDELSIYEQDLARRAFRAARPSVYQEVTLGALAGHICIAMDLRGPIVPLAHGWLSAFDGLVLAMDALREGTIDIALVLAVEVLSESMISQMRADAPALEGLGEGAVALVVERCTPELETAGSTYCQLGATAACRAHGSSDRDAALAEAISASGGACVAAVDGLFGLGGVGEGIDQLEQQALEQVFGDSLDHLHISVPNALIGHTASCGVLFNLAAAALASKRGHLPTTNGARTPAYAARAPRTTTSGSLLASGWSANDEYASIRIDQRESR